MACFAGTRGIEKNAEIDIADEMQEDKHIDDLFRNALLQQDIPVDNRALEEAMMLLDAREKTNVRVIYWITGLLGLLAIGIGLAFFFSREDVPSDTQKPDVPKHTPASSTEQHEQLADTSTNTTRPNDHSNTSESQSTLTAAINGAENKRDSDRTSGDVIPENKSLLGNTTKPTHALDRASHDQNALYDAQTASELTKDHAHKEERSNTSEGISAANGVKSESVNAAFHEEGDTKTQISEGNADVHESDLENNSESLNQGDQKTETAFFIDTGSELDTINEIQSDSSRITKIMTDSANLNPDMLNPEMHIRGFSKWDIRLAGSAFQSYSSVHERNSYSDVYATQRNEQEKALSGFGADLTLSRNNERSFMSAGLGYMRTREDIQYNALKTTQQITSEEYWQYESVLYMIVDGTGTSLNEIVWDTSYMEVNVDSTQFIVYDTTTTTTENTAITAFNGVATWSHIYLPLTYGYRLDHWNSASLYAVGSVEFDYLAASGSHYLSADGQSVQNMLNYPGYRRFMIQGSVGIEWRKLLGGDKFYLLVNPGIRTNLYSWNADFRHSAYSPYLRIGMGWRLAEK